MTGTSRVALLCSEAQPLESWLWFADPNDFEVVAVAHPDPEEAQQLADLFGVPWYPSLAAMFAAASFDTLAMTLRLSGAEQAMAYARERGVRVYCEVVSENPIPPDRIAVLGCDGLDAARLRDAASRSRLELFALADSDPSGIQELAEELGVLAFGSLAAMVAGGRFGLLYVRLPWKLALRAMDYAVECGIRVVCEVPSEPESSALKSIATAAAPGVVRVTNGASSVSRVALYLGPESEPEPMIRRLIESMRGAGMQPVAVVDSDRRQAQRIAEEFGMLAVGSIAEAIEWTELDCFVLAGPPAPHTQAIVDALELDLNVVCSVAPVRALPPRVASGDEPFGFAIYGCGGADLKTRIEEIARIMPSRGGAIVAVADGDIECARRVGDDVGVPALGSIGEVVARADVNGLLVVGPPAAYAEAIVFALGQGLLVYRIPSVRRTPL